MERIFREYSTYATTHKRLFGRYDDESAVREPSRLCTAR